MAKFVYRMQNILNIKLKLESQAKIAYSEANAAYMEQQRLLQGLLIKKAGYDKRMKELLSGDLNVIELNRCRNDVNTLKTLVRRQMMEVHKAELVLEAKRNELNSVMKERKTQEILREKAFDEFKKELLQEESKEIDQLVSFNYNNR